MSKAEPQLPHERKSELDSEILSALREPIPTTDAPEHHCIKYLQRTHAAFRRLDKERTRLAYRMGLVLDSMKRSKRHGNVRGARSWEEYLESIDFEFCVRTADKWIAIYNYFDDEDTAAQLTLKEADTRIKADRGDSDKRGSRLPPGSQSPKAAKRAAAPDGDSGPDSNPLTPERISARLKQLTKFLVDLTDNMDLDDCHVTLDGAEVADGAAQHGAENRYDLVLADIHILVQALLHVVTLIEAKADEFRRMERTVRQVVKIDNETILKSIQEKTKHAEETRTSRPAASESRKQAEGRTKAQGTEAA